MSKLIAPLVLFVLLVCVPKVFAASGGAPLTMTHAGLLLDGNDRPVNDASLRMKFRIFDAVAAGSLQWEASCADVEVTNGRYAVVLGSAACVGSTGGELDAQLDTSDLPPGIARWLEVAIGDVTLSPRLALSSVPSATVAGRALDADRLGGHRAEEFSMAGHAHGTAEITGFDAAAVAAVKVAGLPWSSLVGTPSTFAAAPHTHAAEEITSGKIANAQLHTGAGEGLDADSVDGRHAADFALAAHTHAAAQITDLPAAVQGAISAATSGLTVNGVTLGGSGGSVTASGVVAGGAGVKVGTSTATCDAGLAGLMRFDPATKSMQFCDGTAWTAFAPPTATLESSGSGRRWTDGTHAATCDAYRHPAGGYGYAGLTGDGVYTIDPDGSGGAAPFDVICDMTTSGGGWTLVSNASQVSTSFGSIPPTPTLVNYDVRAKLPSWLGSTKLVKLNFATVLGTFTPTTVGTWTSGSMTLTSSNLRYSGNADSIWIVANVLIGSVGAANHGSWCSGSTPLSLYMNSLAYAPGGVHPGVQASQGSCSDNSVWKDDFSWQVFSK